jgi:competence protein ComEC
MNFLKSKLAFLAVLALAVLVLAAELRVHYVDLGQADCILIQSDESAVLIDGGEYKTRDVLIKYLHGVGVSVIDYVVATHPHSDHIGGLAPVIRRFDVKNVLMPDAIHTSATFEHLLTAVEEKSLKITIAIPGDTIAAGIIKFVVLAPGKTFKDLNNSSVVLRMVHGSTSFLFAGDAERQSEEDMLRRGVVLPVDVLKAGHHGSRTSSTAEFLKAVRPGTVVVMCGKDNKFGHPHKEFLERVGQLGQDVKLLRTDEQGTIVIRTDGERILLPKR